jgi:hypothetical protein
MKVYMILLNRDVTRYPYYGEPVYFYMDYESAYHRFATLPPWNKTPGFTPEYAYHLVLYDVQFDGELLPTELDQK